MADIPFQYPLVSTRSSEKEHRPLAPHALLRYTHVPELQSFHKTVVRSRYLWQRIIPIFSFLQLTFQSSSRNVWTSLLHRWHQ
jgi:hypothetical protein